MQKIAIDGERVREIMKDKDLSVSEVSRRMGVTRATVYNLIDGNNTSLDVITSLAVALDNTNPLDILMTNGFPDPLLDASADLA